MDGMGLQALGLIAATLLCSWVLDWCFRFWRRSKEAQRRQEAEKVLRANGIEVHAYLPSFGAEPGPLRDALAVFDFSGRLLLDKGGSVVGRVLPKVRSDGPGLRLVVDNTK